MVDGFKLSEVTALGGAANPTDQLYLCRAGASLRALVSELRITASQVSDAGATGLALMAAAGSSDVIDELTLSTDSVWIGGAADAVEEFPLSDLGKILMQADPAADVADAADDESTPYTGIDNAQVGDVYAQLTDLNALAVAYEDLRVTYNTLLTSIRSLGLIA